MTEDRNEGPLLPIACTLTPGEVAARRDELLPGLLTKATRRESIPGGFRWRFNAAPGLLREAGAVIDAEHRCCKFLELVLRVEPGDGPVWLEVTGPPGTADFLTALAPPPRTPPLGA